MNVAMGSRLKSICWGLHWMCWAVVLAACTGQTSASSNDAPVMGDFAPADTPAHDSILLPEDDLEDDPNRPAEKGEEELAQLQKQWTDAYQAERKLLMTNRLQAWIDELYAQADPNDISFRPQLTADQFAALSFREVFAYQMYYPEDWSQVYDVTHAYAGKIQAICRKLPEENTGYFLTDRDKEVLNNDTTARPLPDQRGYHWSERQLEALYKDTAEVRKIILECLNTNHAVSIPMMRNIAKFNVKAALIPLIHIYRSQPVKDDLILTTLVELMERLNFWDWVYSPECKAMVVDDYGTLPLTAANVEEIVKYAEKLAAKPVIK
jgi:hypothetical protein